MPETGGNTRPVGDVAQPSRTGTEDHEAVSTDSRNDQAPVDPAGSGSSASAESVQPVKYLPINAPYCPNPANAPHVPGSSDPTGKPMRARLWGTTIEWMHEVGFTDGAACVDLVAHDGRTVQVVFYDKGAVLIRGWAAGDLHEQGGDNRTAFSWSPQLLPKEARDA